MSITHFHSGADVTAILHKLSRLPSALAAAGKLIESAQTFSPARHGPQPGVDFQEDSRGVKSLLTPLATNSSVRRYTAMHNHWTDYVALREALREQTHAANGIMQTAGDGVPGGYRVR